MPGNASIVENVLQYDEDVGQWRINRSGKLKRFLYTFQCKG